MKSDTVDNLTRRRGSLNMNSRKILISWKICGNDVKKVMNASVAYDIRRFSSASYSIKNPLAHSPERFSVVVASCLIDRLLTWDLVSHSSCQSSSIRWLIDFIHSVCIIRGTFERVLWPKNACLLRYIPGR